MFRQANTLDPRQRDRQIVDVEVRMSRVHQSCLSLVLKNSQRSEMTMCDEVHKVQARQCVSPHGTRRVRAHEAARLCDRYDVHVTHQTAINFQRL